MIEKDIENNISKEDIFKITYNVVYKILSILGFVFMSGLFLLGTYQHVLSGVFLFGFMMGAFLLKIINVFGFCMIVDKKEKKISYQKFFFIKKQIIFSEIKYVKLKEWKNTTIWIAYNRENKKLCEVNLFKTKNGLTLRSIFSIKEIDQQ